MLIFAVVISQVRPQNALQSKDELSLRVGGSDVVPTRDKIIANKQTETDLTLAMFSYVQKVVQNLKLMYIVCLTAVVPFQALNFINANAVDGQGV